jgi:putative two-component system response regulator
MIMTTPETDIATILIVEDEPLLCEGLSETLKAAGFATKTAADGLEGLEQLKSFLPDLIISDISMPNMDGRAFFEAVRREAQWITIPFIFLTALSEPEDIARGKDMGAEEYLVKPIKPNELIAATRARLARARQLQLAQLEQAYEASLMLLANAIELRDAYTRGHVERVTAVSLLLGQQLNLTASELHQLRFGAILHDIGKIYIRENILQKAGPLTDEEWNQMRQHAALGADMVKNIPYLATSASIIRCHHERWDGRGYPGGLAGKAIPLGARIVAVADAFDAMTTDRPYRAGLPAAEARAEIIKGQGNHFDPEIAQLFHNMWQAGELAVIQSLVTGN